MVSYDKICDRVYQIGGSNLSHPSDCSVYLVDVGKDEFVMIDSGAGESFSELVENIKSAGKKPEGLKTLILTHCHIDHIGSANMFKKHFGCHILAHEKDADAIEGRDLEATAASWYKVEYEPVAIDTVVTGVSMTKKIGEVEFNIVHIPGHTPGSIAVYCDISDTRILFGQDIHGPLMKKFGSNVDDYKKSMKKLLSLEADILCEGHFGIYAPKDDVKWYIESYMMKFSK
ncbi:MBL fold metallo-hydrolase [[Eubacterium] cellulosolvens]